jgi:hypothetical protein
MASGFPASIDNFTDPLSNSPLNSPSHSALHSDVNDAVEKIETYMGLVKVIPTSVTNGTLSSTGTVTVGTAVSSVTVAGAFSSLYDNYLITANGGASSVSTSMKLSLGATAAGYYYNLVYQSYNASTPTGSGGTNLTNWLVGYAGTAGIDCTINLQSPNLAKNTLYSFSGALATTTGENSNGRGYLADTTQYTAFTLTTNSGTLTGGTIRVYGYRN